MNLDTSTDHKPYVIWPPVINSVEILGYLKDANFRHYPRDVGRSSAFKNNGSVLFVFGDTFSHDYIGRFVAITSSTVSVLLDTEIPKISIYRKFENRAVAPFIPLNQDEIQLAAPPSCSRATLWCFGGIIETKQGDDDIAEGCVFYQKGLSIGPFGTSVYQYTGLAKVRYDTQTGVVNVDRIEKLDIPFFKNDEPQFGTFNTMRVGNTAYLYGHVGPTDTRLMLAKVELITGDEIYNRDNYRYWDGRAYSRSIERVRPIMDGMKHGAIYRSNLFKPGTGRDYVFIGCNRFGDKKVIMGVSATPEGPFLMSELMSTFFLCRNPTSEFTYCVYPHQWAFDESHGELMITWSEGGISGQVVAVKVSLEQRY